MTTSFRDPGTDPDQGRVVPGTHHRRGPPETRPLPRKGPPGHLVSPFLYRSPPDSSRGRPYVLSSSVVGQTKSKLFLTQPQGSGPDRAGLQSPLGEVGLIDVTVGVSGEPRDTPSKMALMGPTITRERNCSDPRSSTLEPETGRVRSRVSGKSFKVPSLTVMLKKSGLKGYKDKGVREFYVFPVTRTKSLILIPPTTLSHLAHDGPVEPFCVGPSTRSVF